MARRTPLPALPILTGTMPMNDFADAINVSKGTVKRWRSEGMPSSESAGHVMVQAAEAIAWIRERARPSTFGKHSLCLVYFARKGELIKIGSSVDPEERLQSMHVEILVTVPGDKRTELAFHMLFADSSVGNEWFRETPELLALISSLKEAA